MKVLAAPNYDGLTIDDFVEKIVSYSAMEQYMPEERDVYRLPRAFLINLFYTVVGEPVRKFVSSVIEERNRAVLEKQRMELELDDEIRVAFEHSTTVACK